jgi:hypothetical protein
MMEWDWHLRTAASTGLLFISGWFAMWTVVWWYRRRLSLYMSTRALWQPPLLSGGPVSRYISIIPSTDWQFCQQWQPPLLSGGPVSRDISISPSTGWRFSQQRHLYQPQILTGSSVSSGSHQYCPVVLPSEISLQQVGEWAKKIRI